MLVRSNEEFKSTFFKNLGFQGFENEYYTLYKNTEKPELGFYQNYSRDGYYHFGIGDYTIPKNFSIDFHNPEILMRFGVVYQGITEFQLVNNSVSSFQPSTFFVIEKNIKGQQLWKKGQHYHGIEITIFEKYFSEIIKPNFSNTVDFHNIINNFTYHYLPLQIIDIIRQLQSLSNENALNSLYLESKILECIAILINEVTKSSENVFTNQINFGTIHIGTNRTIQLNSSDLHAINKARDILSRDYSNPPNISTLSKMVFLNEQKLKAGFTKIYHMPIGEYTKYIRMTVAANLLSTTELSIEQIAFKVGYHYSANFSNTFKKVYGTTPLQFRKLKSLPTT